MKRLLRLMMWLALLAACAPNQTSQSATPASRAASTSTGYVWALAVDPRDGRVLKAASDGFYQSRNEGKSWERLTLPSDIATKDIAHIAIRKDQPDITYIAGEQIGIWRSRDRSEERRVGKECRL